MPVIGDIKGFVEAESALNYLIGNNADKTILGVFAGQGPNGTRGDVFFKIKGNDVVVTKPDGTFITILKDGVNNTSVKNALKGESR
ncbi:hypothetical protein ACSLVK_02320 [Photorhabdus tasmaniensis]|uniref:hypothetical protein n=1 Tax=Photorhabdus tasmaniensis TaxID=1004159 RepID=UPI00404339B0